MVDRASMPLSGGETALICADDFERRLFCEFHDGFVYEGRICDRRWKPVVKDHTTYAVCVIVSKAGQRELRLHRLVLCARARDIVDHVDGNGLNCVRHNLRFVTPAQNCHNRVGQPDSSSRFKGVTLHKQTGKWESHIRHERKKRHLGLFAREVEAARAYDAAAKQLFGEHAALNFPAAK